MLQLTKTTLFHWDLAWEFLSDRSYNEKKDFSGPHAVMKVQMWMAKIQAPSLLPGAGGGLASTHSYATTIANTKFTTSLARPQHSMRPSDDRLGYHTSDLEGSDDAYHKALVTLANPGGSTRLYSSTHRWYSDP